MVLLIGLVLTMIQVSGGIHFRRGRSEEERRILGLPDSGMGMVGRIGG